MPPHHSRATSPQHPTRRTLSSFPALLRFPLSWPAAPPPRHRRTMFGVGLVIMVTLGGGVARAEQAAARPIAADASRAPFATFVAEALQRFGIPSAWIRAVMRAESFGDVRALSPKGAIGLMQIMPDTWAGLRQRYNLGADPYDAHDNIIAGAAYLRELHDRYGIPGFLAAYNAGPGRWEDHVATGRPLPAETRAYLFHLAPTISGGAANDTVLLTTLVRSWTQASLFPSRSDTSSTNTPPPSTQQPAHPSTDTPPRDWTALAPRSEGLFVALSNRERSQ